MDYVFDELEPGSICKDARRQFLLVYQAVNQFEQDRGYTSYHQLFQAFVALGEKLGFTREEVMNAYLANINACFEGYLDSLHVESRLLY